MTAATLDRTTLRPAEVGTSPHRRGVTDAVLTDGTTYFCASPGCPYTAEASQSVIGHRRHCKLKGTVPAPRDAAQDDEVPHNGFAAAIKASATGIGRLQGAPLQTRVDDIVALLDRAWETDAYRFPGDLPSVVWQRWVTPLVVGLKTMRMTKDHRRALVIALCGADGSRMPTRAAALLLDCGKETVRQDLIAAKPTEQPADQPTFEPLAHTLARIDTVAETIELAPAAQVPDAELAKDEWMDVDVVSATVTGQDLERRVERAAEQPKDFVSTDSAALRFISADITIADPTSGAVLTSDSFTSHMLTADGSTSAEQPASRAVRKAWSAIEEALEDEVQRRVRRLNDAARTEQGREVAAERAKTLEWRKRAIDAEGRLDTISKALGLNAAAPIAVPTEFPKAG